MNHSVIAMLFFTKRYAKFIAQQFFSMYKLILLVHNKKTPGAAGLVFHINLTQKAHTKPI